MSKSGYDSDGRSCFPLAPSPASLPPSYCHRGLLFSPLRYQLSPWYLADISSDWITSAFLFASSISGERRRRRRTGGGTGLIRVGFLHHTMRYSSSLVASEIHFLF